MDLVSWVLGRGFSKCVLFASIEFLPQVNSSKSDIPWLNLRWSNTSWDRLLFMADVLTTWMEVIFWIKNQSEWSYWTSPPVANFDPFYLLLKPFHSLRVRCVGMWQFAVSNFRYQRWTTRAIHLIEIAIRKTASVMQVCIYESHTLKFGVKQHVGVIIASGILLTQWRKKFWFEPAPNVSGFIAQLVKASHRYREVTGSNPVEVLTFSGFYTQLLKLRS